jgi:maleamate amidohydrolase
VRTNSAAIGEEAWTAADHIRRLLVAARVAGVPVIHITGLASSGLPSWHASIHAGDRRGDLSVQGRNDPRRYEIVEACAPVDGELVFEKTAPSAFWGTPLSGALTYLGVDTLIVGGESTSGCVRASVVDAASHRYRVVIAEECVYDRHQASHAINLFDMHAKYADVLPLADVVAWLDKYAAGSAG